VARGTGVSVPLGVHVVPGVRCICHLLLAMIVGIKVLLAPQGTVACLVVDLTRDFAMAIVTAAMAVTTTAMRSTVAMTMHRATTTTTAMERSIDTHSAPPRVAQELEAERRDH
jgi:hypothetical protein